ncbi:MAG TPA: hypothetical protein VLU46_13710 [Thermoanaerobaculia bacterium]|nr:hypothetical protein [Thermoanaerobaculia bacterium]
MISPAYMAIAALTVMLWIVWSDTLRSRRPSPLLYTTRIALYLIMSGILMLNMVRYPVQFTGSARAMTILAAVVGIFGAGYFARRLVTRS